MSQVPMAAAVLEAAKKKESDWKLGDEKGDWGTETAFRIRALRRGVDQGLVKFRDSKTADPAKEPRGGLRFSWTPPRAPRMAPRPVRPTSASSTGPTK